MTTEPTLTRSLSAMLFIALVVAANTATAASADHAAPTHTSELSLAEVIDRALERDLGSDVPTSLRGEARALERMSSRWLPGGATFQGSVVDHGTFGDNGYQQWSTALQVPLWWPGQRRRWKEVAESAAATALEAERLGRLEVAGWIRTALERVALAELDETLWRNELESQRTLVDSVERAVELGELARRDLLRVETARLEAEESHSLAREALHESSARYRALTGLDERPTDWSEPVASSGGIDSHPALLVAREAVRRAEGQRRVAKVDGWPAPAASIGTQHERDGGGGGFNDRIVAGIVIPLGRSRNAEAEVAQASVEIARARRDAARLERRLRLELDRAHHERELASARAENAAKRSAMADAHLHMTQRAFELGEVDVSDLVRARSLALAAARDRAAATIRLHAAGGAINQASGIAP